MYYTHDQVELRRGPLDKSKLNTEWPTRLATKDGELAMRNYLTQRGLSYDLAVANGWYPSLDAGDGFTRIVIPARTSIPEHAYWQARAVAGFVKRRYQSPSGPRHDALVRIDPVQRIDGRPVHAKEYDWNRVAVVVEGPMDALAVAECGAVGYALMGATPSGVVIDRLLKLMRDAQPKYDMVFVMPDRDAEKEGIDILYRIAVEMLPVKLLRLYEWTAEKDFAKLPLSQRRVILMGERDAWLKERSAPHR